MKDGCGYDGNYSDHVRLPILPEIFYNRNDGRGGQGLSVSEF